MAVDHFFVGGEISHPSLSERLRGYRETLQQYSLPVEDLLVSCEEPHTGVNDGYEATCKLLDTGASFTAIFASNDTMAVGAMRCLRERNLKIPQDVSIIGFDDIEVCLLVEPHLSTVRVYKEELDAVAVRRLVEMIGSEKKTIDEIVVPVELVIRDSCSPCRQINN